MDNDIKWLFRLDPISDTEIKKIGAEIGVLFPEDYIECAKTNHGAHPDPEVFNIKGRPECVLNKLLSYDQLSKNNILSTYKITRDRLADDVIPFASDPFGNLICFLFKENGRELNSIVFWDHESSGNGKHAGIVNVCSSFSELLSMLYDPDEDL